MLAGCAGIGTEDGLEVSTEAVYTSTACGDRELVANFRLKEYCVIIDSDPPNGGLIEGAGTYHHGDIVTVTAIPAEGYEFTGWTEGDNEVSTETTLTFVAEGNRYLLANFRLKE